MILAFRIYLHIYKPEKSFSETLMVIPEVTNILLLSRKISNSQSKQDNYKAQTRQFSVHQTVIIFLSIKFKMCFVLFVCLI